MASDPLDREISRAQSTAKRKMARIKTVQRFDIANSPHNPLTKVPVSDMTRKQKRSYLNNLKKFNSRDNQYIISARGTVLSQKAWKKYKDAEARANAMVRQDIKQYSKLKMPMGGTLGEYLEAFRPKYGRLGHNNPSGTAMHELNREPTAINDAKSLKELTESQLKKANPNFLGRKLREGRDQFRKMVEAIGDEELLNAANNLSDEQFKVIWNYTNFANAIALDYSIYQQSLIEEQPFHGPGMEQANRMAHDWIEWISKVL